MGFWAVIWTEQTDFGEIWTQSSIGEDKYIGVFQKGGFPGGLRDIEGFPLISF